MKINLAAREVFKDVEIQANNIQNNNLVHIKQLVSDLQVQGNYTVSSTNLEKLDKGIKEFANNTIYRVKVTIDWENGRALVTLILLGIYCFLVLLSLVAFCKTWQRVILVNSLLLLFTLPLILFFQGLNASYYFVYSDVCHSVNDAIYGNAFPIANKGLGYYINCFDKDTKGSLYYLNYELSRISSDIDQKISSDNTSEEDLTKLKLLKEELLIIGMKYLKPMLSCAHVYTSVQDVEKTICTNGMNWSYQLLMSYSWLFLIILLTGISTNKLSSIAWRRRVEMEAMLALEEQTE